MSKRRHRLVALSYAIMVVAGAATANASILTLTAASCTGFALSGVGPNQTLVCVGGDSGGTGMSLQLDDKFCGSFNLTGVAPNQTLVCNFVTPPAPGLVSVVSRKVHGTAGTFDLPLSPGP